MKKIILLISLLATASMSYANFTMGLGIVTSDRLATAPSNKESINDENGEGLAFRIGGDITSNASRAHSLELEITGLAYEDNGKNLYLNTNMINYSYTRFFESRIFVTGGVGLGLAMANIDKDIKDLGFGLGYQGFVKTGLTFYDRAVLVGVAYRWLGYSDLKFDDSVIVENGDNGLISVEATIRF
jgi:hypothetical protein